jgi:hypothetical protein
VKLRTLAARAGGGALAGAAAGTAAGAGARVSMRMLADGFPDYVIQGAPVFTIVGTATILIFGALLGAPTGVLYEAVADRIPGPRVARGVIFSALFFAVEGAELLITTPRVILLVLPFVPYGVTLGMVRRLNGRPVWAAVRVLLTCTAAPT